MLDENERSWAIDVISKGNALVATRPSEIRRFGGESSLSGGRSRLFPDVLLYGDAGKGRVLQGWELKFPDTPIGDLALHSNAREKAGRLGTDSYLVWNVREAQLWSRAKGREFTLRKAWPPLSSVVARADVEENTEAWNTLLQTIVGDLETFFSTGALVGADLAVATGKVIEQDFISRNAPLMAEALAGVARRDVGLRDLASSWWAEFENEFRETTWELPLARTTLLSWLNKILLAHRLKRQILMANALLADSLATPRTAARTAEALAKSYNFYTIFRTVEYELHVPDEVWGDIRRLSDFLMDANIQDFSTDFAHRFFSFVSQRTSRKAMGHFVTPRPLARLLVSLAVADLTDTVADLCSGTGTIAKAALDLKRKSGVNSSTAFDSTWAFDKAPFPAQVTALTMLDQNHMGQLVQVSRHDSLKLSPGNQITFQHPFTGKAESRHLPLFGAIVMNPPYVAASNINAVSDEINNLRQRILEETKVSLSGRADAYSYFSIHSARLIRPGGRLGIVLSNSWLGTEFGAQFREIMGHYFVLEAVVGSGSGRWFKEPDIVTTIAIFRRFDCEEKTLIPNDSPTKFVTLMAQIEDLSDEESVARRIRQNQGSPQANINVVDADHARTLSRINIPWSAWFADLSFFETLEPCLVPIGRLAFVKRGQRRGWNEMFYPPDESEIEQQYLLPSIRSASSIAGYDAQPDSVTFVCNEEIDELKKRGHTGALAWIDRFETATNTTGESLLQVLQRSAPAGLPWYGQSPDATGLLMISVNPFKRLFVARCGTPTFADQRLIRITPKPGINVSLLHALMNCSLGLLFIEALGFPRGLGALDLTPTKFARGFVLDPDLIPDSAVGAIICAHQALIARGPMDLEADLASPERMALDGAALTAVGKPEQGEAIRGALRHLYAMRMAVVSSETKA